MSGKREFTQKEIDAIAAFDVFFDNWRKGQKILIVIDLQYGMLKRLDDQVRSRLLKNITEKLEDRIFDKVVFTKFFNYKGSLFEKSLGYTDLQSAEEQEIPNFLMKYSDLVYDKTSYSAALAPSFALAISKLNNMYKTERVWLCGLDTEACVLSTASDLFSCGIQPIVIESCCASTGGLQAHQAGILCLKRMIGEKNII